MRVQLEGEPRAGVHALRRRLAAGREGLGDALSTRQVVPDGALLVSDDYAGAIPHTLSSLVEF